MVEGSGALSAEGCGGVLRKTPIWDSDCTSMEAPGASGMVKELVN